MRVAVAFLVGVLLFPLATRAEVENVPAHWLDTDRVAPRTSDFEWDGMHFLSPTRGWFVGRPLVLEVNGDDLRVWFVGRTWPARLATIDAVDASSVWAGGSLRYGFGPEDDVSRPSKSEGLFLHQDGAQWTAAETGGIPSLDVHVRKLALAGPADGWAIAGFAPEKDLLSSLLVRFDGHTWQPQAAVWPLGFQWSMADLCLTGSGGGWLVGSRGEGGDRRRPHVLRRQGDTWAEVAVPPVDYPSVRMDAVQCLDDGGAVVLGSGAFQEEWRWRSAEPLLWVYRNGWQRVSLPDELRSVDVGPVAARRVDDIWLAVSDPTVSAGGQSFMHLAGGRWNRVAGPVLPSDIAQRYVVRQIQFVSPTEGWAIAGGQGGGALGRGLIFHYTDGAWRVRNWSWHWWDEKWFGLQATSDAR